MMRYGCGAHMINGHKHRKNDETTVKDIDPVCGMEVDSNEGYGKMHKDKLYLFCSRDCLDKFEQKPENYLSQIDTKEVNQ